MNIALIDPLEISETELNSYKASFEQQGHTVTSYDKRTLDTDGIVKRSKDAEVLIIANLPMKRDVLEQLPKLKMISVAFTGVDHLDVAYCKEKGVAVCNAAGYSTISVAELAVSMALSALRETVACDAATRNLEGRAGRAGQDLADKTVGIIGTGSIGCHAAKLFSAFGCKVIGWSRSHRPEFTNAGGTYVEKEDLFRLSDIVSLHTPLTPETTGIVGEAELAMMKKTATLVNCARGPVVNQDALAAAMKNGEIAHASIDVYDIEPPLPADHPLLNLPNTTLAPHVAYATREAFTRRAKIVFDNIIDWEAGKETNRV